MHKAFLALTAFFLLFSPAWGWALEVEFDKAQPEAPLSDWWMRIVFPPTEEGGLSCAGGGGLAVSRPPPGLGYQEYWPAPTSLKGAASNPNVLMFTVSPASPLLYWVVATADYYDGSGWAKTTKPKPVLEFPPRADWVGTEFQVEFTARANRFSLPIPGYQTNLSELSLIPYPPGLTLYFDELADVYGVAMGEMSWVDVSYKATWTPMGVDGSKISLEVIPPEIEEVYLRLPEDLPQEIRDLAEELRDPSLNPLDQVLADLRYLKTSFTYDSALAYGRATRSIERDWVLDFLERGKGVCYDFNTALAVILRCQGIPSRVSFGFKPGAVVGDRVLYFSGNYHAEAEAYLPPFGWVRFDATPPGFCPGLRAGCVANPALTVPVGRGARDGGNGRGTGDGVDGGRGIGPDGDLEVEPRLAPTHLELSITPENTLREKPVRILVQLTSRGKPLPGATIELTNLTGELLARLTTDHEGKARVVHRFGREERVGTHYLMAKFPGTDLHAPSHAIKSVWVYAPTFLSLSLAGDNVRRGERLRFQGRLWDDFNQGVRAKISILLDGEPKGGLGASGLGVFKGALAVGKDLELGPHTLQAIFKGGGGYLPSRSEVKEFEVLKELEETKAPKENKPENRPENGKLENLAVPENTELITLPENENLALAPTPEVGTEVDKLIISLLITVGVVLSVLYLVAKRVRKETRPERPKLSPSGLERLLSKFEREGKYREGLIAAYHQLLGMLSGSGAYPVKPDQTARELSSELEANLEAFSRRDFDGFVEAYERAMFGKKAITKAEFERAKQSLSAAFKGARARG